MCRYASAHNGALASMSFKMSGNKKYGFVIRCLLMCVHMCVMDNISGFHGAENNHQVV